MRNDCPTLGRKLGSLFGGPRRRDSNPPDLTGRKRVYCVGCGERWIMLDPDSIEWDIREKYPWRCDDCVRIRSWEKRLNDITIPCSLCDESTFLVHPDEEERMSERGWTCGDCKKKRRTHDDKENFETDRS